jgi:uncharacterized linocin/CFP29 family protein
MANETQTALIQHAQTFLTHGGSPAKALMKAGLNTNVLRTNDTLRKQEWELLDETLVGIARQRLIGINDLRAAGLVEPTGGLGIMHSQYEQLGDMSAAEVNFAGVTDGERDSVTFSLISVPVPVISKEFSIDIRRLEASRGSQSHGTPIDRTQLFVAGEKVTEMMEELLFNGFSGGGMDGSRIYGYTTESHVNSYSGSDWGTGTNVTTDVIGMIDKLEADRYFGPYTGYVSATQFGQLRNFFTDGSGDNVTDRLKRIDGLSGLKPGDRLADGTAVLLAMRRDVVDLAVGLDLTVLEWDQRGGWMLFFKVCTALAPRVKYDAVGGSGIVKATGI